MEKINTAESNNHTPNIPLAVCEIQMSGRPFLVCDTHARAFVDLADGNGVRLVITALEQPLTQPCRACWAAQPTDSEVRIILS
jgi:hypothetical protein